MKTLFDFLLPYKGILVFIGALVNIALQFSPLARQFGEIAGNIALVVAWVMLSALALIWIDTWKPQNYGWTLFLAKNGLRAGVLLILSFPLFFVFHRAGFMLPGFPRVEPDATPPETASGTGSLASSVVASGCRIPQCIRSSPPSSLRGCHSAAHGLARS